MDDKMNYYPISREEWHGFYHDGKAPLTEAELDNIKSVNDQISLRCTRNLCTLNASYSFVHERI